MRRDLTLWMAWFCLLAPQAGFGQEPPAGPTADQPQPELQTIPVATPEPQGAPPDTEEAVTLDEIVVTATKREANPRELPASITALRGEDLEKLGYQGQEDFLKLVPGVSFYNDNINTNRITIRGIGADLNTSNTTGVFLGDVPFEEPVLPRVTLDPNPFDLARIEVLKGPQGTLFGGSALNGAVRYVPQEALLQTWEAKTFAQIESVREGDLGSVYGGAVNIPAGDTLAFRVMGFDRRSAGWIDDTQRELEDINSTGQRGGRLMGQWEPSESWKITLMGVVQRTHIDDSSLTDNREGRLSRSTTPQASPSDTRYDVATLGVQYAFDAFDVLSQTSRTDKRFDAFVDASRIGNPPDNSVPSVSITNHSQSKSWMQELRFTSNDGFERDWKWLGGAFFRSIHLTDVTDILASDQALPIPAPVLGALGGLIPGFGGYVTEEGKLNAARGAADPIDVTETALFGEATMTFWDALDVTLGLRAFRTVSESVTRFSGALTVNPDTLQEGGTEAVRAGRLQEQGINPKLALKYTFNPNIAVYAAAARGFRFGGAQVLVGTVTSPAPAFYKSDTLWSYELGVRSQWLHRTLFADVTPFLIDWIDPQLQQADSSGIGAYFDNAGLAQALCIRGALVVLLVQAPELVSAAALVGGSLPRNPAYEAQYQRLQPRAVMFVNGTADDVVPYQGGRVRLFGIFDFGEVYSAEETVMRWVRAADLNQPPVSTHIDRHDDGTSIDLFRRSQAGRPEVRAYRVNGGKHTIPMPPRNDSCSRMLSTSGDMNTIAEAWSFFSGSAAAAAQEGPQ